MTRDTVAEKKIHRVAWIYWKLSAIFVGLFSLAFGSGIFYLLWQKKSRLGGSEIAVILGVAAIVAGISFVNWCIGRSLEKFRGWARWLTVGSAVISLPGSLLYFGASAVVIVQAILEKGLMSGEFAGSIALFILYGLSVWLCVWTLRVLLGKRGRKVFSRDYQNRLKHNAFDRLEVTPR